MIMIQGNLCPLDFLKFRNEQTSVSQKNYQLPVAKINTRKFKEN
jgi:hypothetical protein